MIDTIRSGDCLNVLKEFPDSFVHLVYMDPPFFTQKTHSLKSKKREEFTFDDNWESMSSYLVFLRTRLVEVKRVMRDDATIFVHCDRNASHHIRMLLDDIFGERCFLSEIIWTYRRWSNSSKQLLPAHQTIFMYSKSDEYTFNELTQPYSNTTNLDQILQKRVRDEDGKTVYAEDNNGRVILNGPKKGVPLSDVWEIPYLNPKARERTGYPTQKPLLLLERVVELASNPEDIVLDPFCGSGTTLVAAKENRRHYIGIDISEQAVDLARQRIRNPVKSESSVFKKGRDAYANLPDYVQAILSGLPVKLVQRNSGIDAIHDLYIDNRPVVLRVQRQGEALVDAARKLQKAGQTKDAVLMFLIKIHQKNSQTAMFHETPLPDEVIVIDSVDHQIHLLVEEQTHKNRP